MVLIVANTLSRSDLDHEVPLDSRAADNIVSQRPFDTLTELDALPYVAGAAFGAMLEYGEATGVLDSLLWVHDVEEGSAEAVAILMLANTLSRSDLDHEVPLDSRAASNIVAAREKAPLTSLAELDAVSYVGQRAFTALLDYAEHSGLL